MSFKDMEEFCWKNEDGTITLKNQSMYTGKWHFMRLPTTIEKMGEWIEFGRQPGTPLIQDHFTELDMGQREFVLTGIHPAEWEEMHAGGEE